MSASEARDYYAILGVEAGASFVDIKKAYRKQALTLHPDKNVGREKEVSVLFDQLRKAYAFLSDEKNRQVYEAQMQAKAARSKKQEQETGQIKAMREVLERKEAEFKSKRMGGVKKMTEEESSRMQTAALIQEMREQGILKSSQRRSVPVEPPAQRASSPAPTAPAAVKVKWSKEAAYTDAELRSYFELFGDIDRVAIRNRTALVVFVSAAAASAAVTNVQTAFPGLFKVDLVRGSSDADGGADADISNTPHSFSSKPGHSSSSFTTAPVRSSGSMEHADVDDAAIREFAKEEEERKAAEFHDDKERFILERMRKAEEARRQRQAAAAAMSVSSSAVDSAAEPLEPTGGPPFFRPSVTVGNTSSGTSNQSELGATAAMDTASVGGESILGKRKLQNGNI